jgi:hypothetical protein
MVRGACSRVDDIRPYKDATASNRITLA